MKEPEEKKRPTFTNTFKKLHGNIDTRSAQEDEDQKLLLEKQKQYGVGQFAPPKEEKKQEEDDEFDQRAKGDKRDSRRGGRGRGGRGGHFDNDRPKGERPKFFNSDKEGKLKKNKSEQQKEEPKKEEAKKPWSKDADLQEGANYADADAQNWF